SASVISGTSRPVMVSTPRSVAEYEVMATAAAATVMIETAAKATCSLTLIPRPRIQPGSLNQDRGSSREAFAAASAGGADFALCTTFIDSLGRGRPRTS